MPCPPLSRLHRNPRSSQAKPVHGIRQKLFGAKIVSSLALRRRFDYSERLLEHLRYVNHFPIQWLKRTISRTTAQVVDKSGYLIFSD